MKKLIVFSVPFVLLVLACPRSTFAAKVGQSAPDCSGTASDSRTYHLGDYHGEL
jgi:hypothetical protein